MQTIHFHSKCVDGGSCGSCPVNLQQIANKPIHTIRKDGFSTGLDGVVVFFNAGRADGNAGVLQEELRVDIAQNLAVSLGLHDLDQKRPEDEQSRLKRGQEGRGGEAVA